MSTSEEQLGDQAKAEQPAPDKLIEALTWYDDADREARARRIRWISPHDPQHGIVVGPTDTMSVLREARTCFVEGRFIAAQVLALAFFEHVLMERLTDRGLIKGRPTLEQAIKVGLLNDVLPAPLLNEAERLRPYRNPFMHRQDPDTRKREHSLGHRVMDLQRHPNALLEEAAKAAMLLMLQSSDIWVKSGRHELG